MNTPMQIPRPPLAQLEARAQWITLLAISVALHVFEAALPNLGPWFKPGLANIVVLIALAQMGPKAAVTLAIGRVVIGSFMIGTLATPTFVMSFSGAIAATAVMLVAWRLIPGISLVGISLLAAIAHMTAQFAVAETLFIQQAVLYYLLPPMLLLSCTTGWLNGVLAAWLVPRLKGWL